MRLGWAAVVFTAVLAVASTNSAYAGESFYDSGTFRQVVLGTGSGLVSLVYTPVKVCYAAGATITGGLILAFTGGEATDVAVRVVRRGTRGDWWVHPDVFTGHRRLRFSGSPD
jgi:hypothetical protein